MALSRDKRSLLLTVAAMLGIVAFFQIVGYGRLVGTGTRTGTGAGARLGGGKWSPSSSYDVGRRIAYHQQSMGPEGRACLTHICVFFDVTFDGELGGRIIFLLYDKKAPRTVENFRSLATGELGVNEKGVALHYKNTTFHRVVHGLLVQGGDILKGYGKEGEVVSIYGSTFATERRDDKFDQKGLLAMDSMGPDKNGSVFFITVDAVPEIDGQYVVFGEVIEGMEVVERINSSTIQEDETPRIPIVISECGQL